MIESIEIYIEIPSSNPENHGIMVSLKSLIQDGIIISDIETIL